MEKNKKFIELLLIFGCLFFIGFSNVAKAAEYYVATNGNDANPGTISQPWKTIQKSASTMHAGDTVYVRGGTYYQDGICGLESVSDRCGIAVTISGTSASPIVFKAYSGEKPIIDGGGTYRGFYIYRANYITIDGFEIKNVVAGGVKIEAEGTSPATGIIIQNNSIHDVAYTDNVGCVFINHGSNITIQNNIFYNVSVSGDFRNQNAAGIITFHLANGLIKNNTVYNMGSGIRLKYPTQPNVEIANNFVHAVKWGIVIGPNNTMTTQNNSIHNNIVYDTNYAVYVQVADASTGISIEKNTLVNNITGIFLQASPATVIRNNIVYNNDIAKQSGTYTETLTMRYQRGATDVSASDYNLFWHMFSWKPIEWVGVYYNLADAQTNTSTELHSIQDAPSFVSLGADFHLTSGSKGKGAGLSGIDIGAYSYGNEIIGYVAPTTTDTTPPSAPSGLVVN